MDDSQFAQRTCELLQADYLAFWRLAEDGAAHPDLCAPHEWLTQPFTAPLLDGQVLDWAQGDQARRRLPLAARRSLPQDDGSVVLRAAQDGEAGLIAVWRHAGQVPAQAERLAQACALNWSLLARHRAQADRVRSAHVQLESLLQALPQGVMVIPPKGRPGLVNATAAGWLGVAAGALGSGELSDALHQWLAQADNHTEFAASAGAIVTRQQEAITGFRLHFGQGELIVRVTVAPIEAQAAGGWVWLLEDVTARHRGRLQLEAAKAQAERANQAKSDFLATMSHELRTPLNAILGFARVLENSLEDPEQRRQARYVRETGETLTAILNDVLDLAKIEAGKFDLDPRPFELAQVFESCASVFRLSCHSKGVQFEMRTPDAVPTLIGDAVRLRQLLQNLLSNAVKFTAKGTVSLWLDLEPLEPSRPQAGRCMVRMRVRDTGLGMDEEQMGRLFRRYEQASRSTAGTYGGTGLGLSIVKALVERMEGSIAVRSVRGQGSEFEVRIPFDVADAAAVVAPASVKAEATGASLRVLVVDDFHVNRHVLRALLQQRGHSVVEAEDGVQALEAVQAHRPDLVLMDVDMPNMDGLEACRRLRAIEAQAQEPRRPVFALTGKAFAEDIAKCQAAGMDGHLAKPIQLDDLMGVLRTVQGAIKRH